MIFTRGSKYFLLNYEYVQFNKNNFIVSRIWDFNRTNEPLESIKQHTEFAYGIDWNPLRRNQLADCGWDSLVNVFNGGLT